MSWDVHLVPPAAGSVVECYEPGVARHDPALACRLLPALLKQGILALRSAAWSGETVPRDVAEVADALHNLPDFLGRADAADGFDHRHFLALTALPLLRRCDPGASDMMRRVGEAWLRTIAREYGQAAADGLLREAERLGPPGDSV